MRGAWFVRGVLGLGLAGMMALAPMAIAQVPEQPAQGSLHPPTAAERAAAAKPAAPPSAAPRTGVQQVSPYATPMPTPTIKSGKAAAAKPAHAPTGLGHSAPGKTSALDHKAATEKAKAKAKGKAEAAKPDGKTAPAKPDAAKPDAAKPEAAKPDAKADAPAVPAGAEPQLGTMTKQPLPRWASLKTDEVNIRSGPGSRYPIQWVYHRTMLPVQIEREFDNWRLIEDQEGVKGWAHTATLTSRRSFVVRPGAERVMRRSAAEDASPVARLQPGVVGRLRACEAQTAWCEVQLQGYRGWLRRDDIYGLSPGEAVAP